MALYWLPLSHHDFLWSSFFLFFFRSLTFLSSWLSRNLKNRCSSYKEDREFHLISQMRTRKLLAERLLHLPWWHTLFVDVTGKNPYAVVDYHLFPWKRTVFTYHHTGAIGRASVLEWRLLSIDSHVLKLEQKTSRYSATWDGLVWDDIPRALPARELEEAPRKLESIVVFELELWTSLAPRTLGAGGVLFACQEERKNWNICGIRIFSMTVLFLSTYRDWIGARLGGLLILCLQVFYLWV